MSIILVKFMILGTTSIIPDPQWVEALRAQGLESPMETLNPKP